MKMINYLLFISILLTFGSNSKKENITFLTKKPVNDTVQKIVEFISNEKNSKNFLIQKFYPQDEGGGVEVSFIIKNKTYKIYCNLLGEKFLTFYVKQSDSKDFPGYWADCGADGTVDFGQKNESYINRQMYSNYSDDLVGKEYKPYWQKKYNNAIVEIINYFNLIATNR